MYNELGGGRGGNLTEHRKKSEWKQSDSKIFMREVERKPSTYKEVQRECWRGARGGNFGGR